MTTRDHTWLKPQAALEFLLQSGRQPDILHCHDWSTAPVASLYWHNYHNFGLGRPRVVFTIHNAEYGLAKIGAAAHHSQRFTTVSPKYREDVRPSGTSSPTHVPLQCLPWFELAAGQNFLNAGIFAFKAGSAASNACDFALIAGSLAVDAGVSRHLVKHTLIFSSYDTLELQIPPRLRQSRPSLPPSHPPPSSLPSCHCYFGLLNSVTVPLPSPVPFPVCFWIAAGVCNS